MPIFENLMNKINSIVSAESQQAYNDFKQENTLTSAQRMAVEEAYLNSSGYRGEDTDVEK